MTILERIESDLSTAMKEGHSADVAVLRLLKNSLKNEQIKLGHELSDDETLKVLQREAKQRRDSIEAYRQANRADMAEAEEGELAVISNYLPEQMEEAELAGIVESVIAETGATGKSQMGQVIGLVMKRVAGRADGAAVSNLVARRLN
jgi:uncharacterized protein